MFSYANAAGTDAESRAGLPRGYRMTSARLQSAVARSKAQGRLALYFGCLGRLGHFLHKPTGPLLWDIPAELEIPWTLAHMDGGLLKNGERPDTYDGKVYWTCGGLTLWYALYWWDRSFDHRGASNSGFYVRGFAWPEAQDAFDYACSVFPQVVARQKHPLVLQEPVSALVSQPSRDTRKEGP